jgi:hypothetical protein
MDYSRGKYKVKSRKFKKDIEINYHGDEVLKKTREPSRIFSTIKEYEIFLWRIPYLGSYDKCRRV